MCLKIHQMSHQPLLFCIKLKARDSKFVQRLGYTWCMAPFGEQARCCVKSDITHLLLFLFFLFSAPETQGRRICNVWLCSTERRWHESERPSQHFLNLFSNDILVEHESQSIRWGRFCKVRRVETGFNKDINTCFLICFDAELLLFWDEQKI